MSVNIIIPKFKEGEASQVWFERALREGNFLDRYLKREKANTNRRMVNVAQPYRNYQRPRGSEFDLMSVMDMRTFIRWQQAEPGILEDKKEFQKLVRDNRVMTPWKP